MKTRLRAVIATLTLTAAATTGYALTNEPIAQPAGDTTWGAPATTGDTRWDTLPTDPDSPGTITPLDTTWG